MLWVIHGIKSMNVEAADQRLTSQVHEIVGRINGRYGSVTFVPIHHLVSSKNLHVSLTVCSPCSCVPSLLL